MKQLTFSGVMVQLHFDHMSHFADDYEKKMKLEVLDQESLGKTHILCSKKFTKQTTYFRVPNGCPPPRPVLSPTAIIFKNIFQQRRIRTLTSIYDGAS